MAAVVWRVICSQCSYRALLRHEPRKPRCPDCGMAPPALAVLPERWA